MLPKAAATPNTPAEAALQALAIHGLPATPRNYEIWYTYHVGGNPELQRKVDQLTQDGRALDEAALSELHGLVSQVERQQQQALTAAERIMRELAEVMTALRSNGDRADAYAEHLQSTSSSLSDGLDIKALREIVAGLAAATVDMAEHNRKLSQRLDDSAREMTSLRSTLQRARSEALTDPLTTLANRKLLSETLHMRVREAAGQGTPLCLLICDIDHFKRFNDTWGHPTGDQIIRFIASVLSKLALPDFLCARYGGEEFCVVMPRQMLPEAQTFAEQVRTTIETKKLFRKSTNEDLGRVTISLGVAQWRTEDTVETLIERADACLYASKRAGRNRVTTDRQIGARGLSAA